MLERWMSWVREWVSIYRWAEREAAAVQSAHVNQKSHPSLNTFSPLLNRSVVSHVRKIVLNGYIIALSRKRGVLLSTRRYDWDQWYCSSGLHLGDQDPATKNERRCQQHCLCSLAASSRIFQLCTAWSPIRFDYSALYSCLSSQRSAWTCLSPRKHQ